MERVPLKSSTNKDINSNINNASTQGFATLLQLLASGNDRGLKEMNPGSDLVGF